MNSLPKILLCTPCNHDIDRLASVPPLMLIPIAAAVEVALPGLTPYLGTLDTHTLDTYKPDIVGISCFSAFWDKCKALAKECKQRGISVIVGGPHINARPRDITTDMDIAVRGEGERVVPSLLRFYDTGWKGKDLAEIPGLLYWSAGELMESGPPEIIANLDELPIPILPKSFVRDGTLHILTTRGCPFKCTFCSSQSHEKVRSYSADYIVRYIRRHIKRYPHIDRVKFWDDLFTWNRRRVKQICAALNESRLIHLNYHVSIRADQVTPEIIRLFRKMHVTNVYMGLESGSSETLKHINKGYDLAKIHRALFLLKNEPFTLEASFVVGFPHEGHRQLQETFDLIRAAPLNLVQVFLLTPYPGTIEWTRATSRGVVRDSPDFEWYLLDQNVGTANPKQVLTHSIVVSEHLNRRELYHWLLRFRRYVVWTRIRHTLNLLLCNPRRFLLNVFHNSPLQRLRSLWSSSSMEHL
ncbi:methyltransferase [Candidatus Magnetomorum sp. HK-1]|nr:methyltransferase [Candidatus Magnetomorum sp. HK-1]